MPCLEYPNDKSVEVDETTSILHASRQHSIPHTQVRGGTELDKVTPSRTVALPTKRKTGLHRLYAITGLKPAPERA